MRSTLPMRPWLAAFSAATWLVAVLQASPAGARGARGRPAAPVTATEQNDNTQVYVPKGGTLVVRLESNATTGYSWRITKDDARVLKPVGKPVYERPDSRLMGAPGHQRFRFKGAAKGTTELELAYFGPGTNPGAPAKTYHLTVIVQHSGMVTVTESDNNREVNVPAGDILVVRLSSNPTTGYGWQVTRNDGQLLKAAGKPKFQGSSSGRMGAGGQQVFRFKAPDYGGIDAVLGLQYSRPFEKDKPPAKTFQVTVHVTK
jgi:predicted secreted protein